MQKDQLGYTKPLFILPFDHRTSFLKKMFGIAGAPTPEQARGVCDYKEIIYEGFKKAVESGGVPKENAALLVDEEFGDAILRKAVPAGYTVCLATEKSGQDEFDFQYGQQFGDHIEKYKPAIVKVLIRYNPESDAEMNTRQRERLKILSDYCHTNTYKFLIEPLIPATEEQLAKVGGDQHRYDTEVRYELMVRMVAELQEAGIEPDIWKIEGLEEPKQYEVVIKQARSGGRGRVSAVVLGRGADSLQVERWLRAGANVEGIVGFAIGRTIFWQPLAALRKGEITAEQAVENIAENYSHFYRIFTSKAV